MSRWQLARTISSSISRWQLARTAITPKLYNTRSAPLPCCSAKAARFLLPSLLMTLVGTIGVLLIGLRMQIAGVLAVNAKDLVNPDGFDGVRRKGGPLQLQLVLVRWPRLLAPYRP